MIQQTSTLGDYFSLLNKLIQDVRENNESLAKKLYKTAGKLSSEVKRKVESYYLGGCFSRRFVLEIPFRHGNCKLRFMSY